MSDDISNKDWRDADAPLDMVARVLDFIRQARPVEFIFTQDDTGRTEARLKELSEFVFKREGATDLFLWLEAWSNGIVPTNVIIK